MRQQWHAAWGNRRGRINAVVGERWQAVRRSAIRLGSHGAGSQARTRALGGDPVMLTGWAGGRDAAVALLPPVTLSAVADTDAAPTSAGEACAGFSLPELLAALAAYSMLLTVALHLFPSLHRGAEGAILQLKLMR